MKLYSAGIIGLFLVFMFGSAVNIADSDDPIDSFPEATERAVDGIKEGFSRDKFVSHELNE